MNVTRILLLTLVCAACETSGPDRPVLVQSADPSGCVLEHVAVEAGTHQYSPDLLHADAGRASQVDSDSLVRA